MANTLREELAGRNIQLKENEGITHAIVRLLINAPEKTAWQLAQEYKKMNKERQKEIQELARELLLKQKRKAKRLQVGDTFQLENIPTTSAGTTVGDDVGLSEIPKGKNVESTMDESTISELIPLVFSKRVAGSHMIGSMDACENMNSTQKIQANRYIDIPNTEDACSLKSSGGMSIRDKLGYTEIYVTKKGSPPIELVQDIELGHDKENSVFYIKHATVKNYISWGKDEKNFFTLIDPTTKKSYTAHLTWIGNNKKDMVLTFESGV